MSEVHLSRTELIQWRDDGAGDRARILAHLATCANCREMAADVERHRPAENAARFDARDFVAQGYRAGGSAAAPRSPRRWMWSAAAAALLVIALTPVWVSRFNGGPDTMRGGTTIRPLRPVDIAVSADEISFEWQGTTATDRVRLNVVDLDRADEPLIEREITGSRYDPTPDERRRFRSGQSLHWYVEARSGSSGTSPAASFRVR